MIENEERRDMGGVAVRCSAHYESMLTRPSSRHRHGCDWEALRGVFAKRRRDFCLDSGLAVTLVQRRKLQLVHFFLDFIFH
jgi:hypothetical protein